MSDQATIDIPTEAKSGTIADASLVKKGFFRRLFDVSFFPFIWLFSPKFLTVDYFASSSTSAIVDLLPSLLSSLLLSPLLTLCYIPLRVNIIISGFQQLTATKKFYMAFILSLTLETVAVYLLLLPLLGFLITFFTPDRFSLRHCKFYHSTFILMALIMVALDLSDFEHSVIPDTGKVSYAVKNVIRYTVILVFLVFIKSVSSHHVKFKRGILDLLHTTAIVLGTAGLLLLYRKVLLATILKLIQHILQGHLLSQQNDN